MNSKEILKSYIEEIPEERRLKLEKFVENDISNRDINKAINYVKQLSIGEQSYSIIEMGYSNEGDFYLTAQICITFFK